MSRSLWKETVLWIFSDVLFNAILVCAMERLVMSCYAVLR